MSNLVTSASRRSALNPARKPATDWRSRLIACPTRYKVGVVVALLLGVLGWLGFSSHQQAVEPVKLFASKITPRQLQECSQYLSKMGVDHRPSPEGDNLMVAPEKRLALLNQMGHENIPHDDPANKIVSSGLTPSRREALAREQAELQLSLGATLQAMQGVDNAVVQLALPESSAFEENNHPTASVMLTLASGYEMSQRQSLGIAKFVAGAVPAMRPQDVTVVDQTGREQMNGGEGQLDSMQFELQKQLELYMQGKAQRMLDMAYGRGNALAIVNVQLDFSQLEVKNNIGSDQPLVQNISKESYSSPSQVTTFMEEKDGPSDAAGKKGKTYEKVVEAVRRSPHEALTWRVFKLPRLERVTCAVLIEQQSQRQAAMDMVQGAIGMDESRGDHITASVVPLHRENAGLKSIAPTPLPLEQPTSSGPIAWVGLAGALALGAGIWWVGQRRVRLNQPVLETPKFDGLATQCDLNFRKEGAPAPGSEATATQPRVLEKLEALARQSPKETASLLRSFMDTNTMN
ncbi:MAG: hypothetical protein KF760_05355 [Candidatus Eremiobacteraeota bacterium]|nr:hypothetical protein [Candidatus Eremiobacteraeota bacterium]MCW5867754.1 hypothetical protein [Candidatus Eremiobacteraeota bacterium]